MQELLFGTSSASQTNHGSSAGSNYSLQKPQPVRPSATSAFSAYKPAGRYNSTSNTNNTSSPSKQQSYSSGYSGLDNLRSRTNYLTNLGSDERYLIDWWCYRYRYQPQEDIETKPNLIEIDL